MLRLSIAFINNRCVEDETDICDFGVAGVFLRQNVRIDDRACRYVDGYVPAPQIRGDSECRELFRHTFRAVVVEGMPRDSAQRW